MNYIRCVDYTSLLLSGSQLASNREIVMRHIHLAGRYINEELI